MIGPGTRLGPYEVLSPLGAGGMGEVWRARDTTLDREVALKFLPAAVAADAERLARFEREAKVLASLNHPSIAAIYGFHEHAGQRFLAMELVPGLDLAERLKSGPLPVAEAVDVALQIAEALEAAHERGIVHRDLKPANVKRTPEGKVKVLDFGLAKALDPTGDSTRDASMSPTITSLGTVSGVILGTAAYMSPEAARGRSVDKRADIWAFGCVLYEMLAGRLAFSGETISDTMAAVLTREPDWTALPSGTPARVKRLLALCLQKDPKERLRDIGDGRIALREAPAEAESAVVRTARVPAWIYGAVALIAVVAALAGTLAGRRSVDTRPPIFRPLTGGNGAVYSARLTPDGGSLIYGAAFEGKPLALYSMRTEGQESRPIDLPSADIVGISRGSQLALLLDRHYMGSWLRSGTLAQVALSGGTPRELLENVFDADIAPDGDAFAVVVADGESQVLQYPIGKELFRTTGWISQPRIAPDGRRVAFVDHRLWGDDLGEVKLADADGKVSIVGAEEQYSQGVSWAPDGKTIWYSNSDDFAGGCVYAAVPGGAPRLVARTPTPVRIQDVTADGRVLVITDDTWVALTGQLAGDAAERNYSFWVGEGVVGITEDGTAYAGSDNVVVDGEYSVFFRRGTSAPIRLGPGNAGGMTADGKFVLATRLSSGARGLELLPVGPGQRRPLDLHGVEFRGHLPVPVHLSSNGRRLAFLGAKPGQGVAVWVLDLDDGIPHKVSPEGATAAMISPDGNKVLVVDASRGVAVISSAGMVPVPGAKKTDLPLAWSADGTAILTWDQVLPPRIFKTDIASGRRELFREIHPADSTGTVYALLVLSPDGRYYMLRSRRMRGTVMLMTVHG